MYTRQCTKWKNDHVMSAMFLSPTLHYTVTTGVPNIFINLFSSKCQLFIDSLKDTASNHVIISSKWENVILEGSNLTTKYFNTNYIWTIFNNKEHIKCTHNIILNYYYYY